MRPWKVVGTLNLDSSYVTFKYFAFFCRSSWIHYWLLLAVLSDYFGHLVTSTFLLCKSRDLPGSTPVSFPVLSR